jgi:hypothetical protein
MVEPGSLAARAHMSQSSRTRSGMKSTAHQTHNDKRTKQAEKQTVGRSGRVGSAMRCVDSRSSGLAAVFPDAFTGALFPPLFQPDDLARRAAVHRIGFCAPASRRASGDGCFNQVGGAPTGASPTLPLLGATLVVAPFCRLAEASD